MICQWFLLETSSLMKIIGKSPHSLTKKSLFTATHTSFFMSHDGNGNPYISGKTVIIGMGPRYFMHGMESASTSGWKQLYWKNHHLQHSPLLHHQCLKVRCPTTIHQWSVIHCLMDEWSVIHCLMDENCCAHVQCWKSDLETHRYHKNIWLQEME